MAREILTLNRDWSFTREDHPGCEAPGYEDRGWATVRVPHDWAISGPFDKEHDIHRIESPQADVGAGVTEISGRTGGLPHVGVGWYRKKLRIPAEAAGKQFRLEVDGAMSRSQVYCNGLKMGGWPYGYSSFALDLTAAIRPGEDNLIAIRLENLAQSSRWYPGAGLYRHVRLVMLNPIHVDHWGTYVTTPEVSKDLARLHLQTRIKNSGEPVTITLRTSIRDDEGVVVAQHEVEELAGAGCVVEQDLQVEDPKRWMPGEPNLYQIVTEVFKDGEAVDRVETPLGFRSLTFDPEQGFFINGVHMKLNGVCMHHDLGPLGAAVNLSALRRQLTLLQEMGCNAIRTSHNPPTPELLALCDSMGFLLIDEAFDEWKIGKLDHGYHIDFDEWAEKDLRAMIRRDRNHPCVIMWSIGNEIMEQWDKDGGEVAAFLHEICRDEDPSRPTTAGFNEPHKAVAHGLADAVDIPGWNYYPHDYVKLHDKMAGKPTYGSETESTLSSRGEYHFPVNEEVMPIRDNLQVNSFDMCYPPWAYSPDVEFRAQDDCPFILGEFVWTGFDYLGEPTPYVEQWPSRSSYFGIIDLCGIPKDRYYLYQSKWTDKEVLHLLPHWTWPGREGECTPVHCYSGFNTVELFLNGNSLGRRSKRVNLMMGAYRLVWPDVRYEPGELRAVAYDDAGNPVAETTVRTAGEPARIELRSDRETLQDNGEDMAFVTVRILDADGNLCPTADPLVTFEVSGPVELAAVGNGNAASLEPFQANYRRAFNGQCMVYLRSCPGTQGDLRLTARSEGLVDATVSLTTT